MEEMSPQEARQVLVEAGWRPSELEVWRRGLEQVPELIEAFKAHCVAGAAGEIESLVARENAEARGAVKAYRAIVLTIDTIIGALREVEDA